jgi:ComF family protein
MTPFKTLFHDLLGLLYPNVCLACHRSLPTRHECICLECQINLPKTNFHQEADNPFTERFWGRLDIKSGAALYHFVKGGRVQELIHQLKYLGKRQVGHRLGKWYGEQLRAAPLFKAIDVIVPVPLHARKERLRGFNQSAVFAAGLSEAMHVPALPRALVRRVFTETQTNKSRLERLANVQDVFAIQDEKALQGKHILLVDDVMTTGATLEACGTKILEVKGTQLSLATIALAEF